MSIIKRRIVLGLITTIIRVILTIRPSVPQLSAKLSITASDRSPSLEKIPVGPILVEITADYGMIAIATGTLIAEADAERSRLTLVSLWSGATSGRLIAEDWSEGKTCHK